MCYTVYPVFWFTWYNIWFNKHCLTVVANSVVISSSPQAHPNYPMVSGDPNYFSGLSWSKLSIGLSWSRLSNVYGGSKLCNGLSWYRLSSRSWSRLSNGLSWPHYPVICTMRMIKWRNQKGKTLTFLPPTLHKLPKQEIFKIPGELVKNTLSELPYLSEEWRYKWIDECLLYDTWQEAVSRHK